MSRDLEGTVALVTGATSGIGRAVAVTLASYGAAVAVVGRRSDRLDELAAEIGERCLVLPADLRDPVAATGAVSATVERFGRLDTVVNNAGRMLNGPTLEATLEEWETMVDLNLKALMYVTKAALPHLVDAAATGPRRVADLVNISSIAGRFANRNVAIYNATKFGVTAASESWRQEFAPHHVRVSVIEPGVVETELFGHQQQPVQEHYERLFADVEPLLPSDIADVIAFVVRAPRRMGVAEVVVRPTTQA
ncbi:SDR family oxidoreductase [Nocardioides mangrovi]|uniref:SDR family NAD(P)-dependent oxidoreductase n=1 Tax=Nocardioides mangrovi TaxID=2874580 RepID=A0ABS7UCM6_9ACTN|nr:SDR family NAD(P)-dependent oxidoreductase [Nocardioides mangrovi]MBZ5738418.1 SDR family NAD(P)-dependent oxidoreductase [Nocardioides mangrovi]